MFDFPVPPEWHTKGTAAHLATLEDWELVDLFALWRLWYYDPMPRRPIFFLDIGRGDAREERWYATVGRMVRDAVLTLQDPAVTRLTFSAQRLDRIITPASRRQLAAEVR
jgi:hypothetical protein